MSDMGMMKGGLRSTGGQKDKKEVGQRSSDRWHWPILSVVGYWYMYLIFVCVFMLVMT